MFSFESKIVSPKSGSHISSDPHLILIFNLSLTKCKPALYHHYLHLLSTAIISTSGLCKLQVHFDFHQVTFSLLSFSASF